MSDAQSLTLPKASKSRVKIRRPKRPSGWQLLYLACAMLCAAWAVVGTLTESSPWPLVFWSVPIGFYWRAMHRGSPLIPVRDWQVLAGWYAAWLFGYIALNAAGVV